MFALNLRRVRPEVAFCCTDASFIGTKIEGVRPGFLAVRCIKFCTDFEGCTDWLFLLYGAFNTCTDFEEGTSEFIAIRAANKLHRYRGSVRPVCCCTDCIYWHEFQGDVRPGAAVQLHLVWHRKEEGCTAGLLSTNFQTLR